MLQILCSATLDAEKFKAFFAPPRKNKWDLQPSQMAEHPTTVGMISIMGRAHPVRQLYAASPHRDYLAALIETVVHIHRSEPAGDILAFLTGQVAGC